MGEGGGGVGAGVIDLWNIVVRVVRGICSSTELWEKFNGFKDRSIWSVYIWIVRVVTGICCCKGIYRSVFASGEVGAGVINLWSIVVRVVRGICSSTEFWEKFDGFKNRCIWSVWSCNRNLLL